MLASGIEPRPSWLELIPLVALLVVFSTGVTMLLSALYVRYRDMQPIWEVALQILFYASPVIYVTATLPDSIEREAMANPLTAILTQMRHALIDPTRPDGRRGDRRRRSPAHPAARGRGRVRARRLGVRARGAADRGGPVTAESPERA